MDKNKIRHVLGLSGGKDSAALAIYLHDKIPNIEYFFCDTGCELPETYDFLERLKARLGIKITYLNKELILQNDPEAIFKYWLTIYNGFLPSPKARWCTRQLKITPLENFIGGDEAISYIAIRADENRDGYISTKNNISSFPSIFKEKVLSIYSSFWSKSLFVNPNIILSRPLSFGYLSARSMI